MKSRINAALNRLLRYGLKRGLIEPEDFVYTANRLMNLYRLDEFTAEPEGDIPQSADEILEPLLDLAASAGLLENTLARRDLFDTLIMDQLTPRPSEVSARFKALYEQSPRRATDWFYAFSQSANYVRQGRTNRNQSWLTATDYGELQITINVSKPEKDPRDIAAARALPPGGYPACLLCRENEGFFGHLNHPARQNLRLIALELGGERWFLQYSPYVYYNEHCIILSSRHRPMKIDGRALANLLEFLDWLPHYFVGSNADLPIVGGSILSHDHYQGGRHVFPMNLAKVERDYRWPAFPDVSLGRVAWPMSVLRLRGGGRESLVHAAETITHAWRAWTDESVDILAQTGDQPHNTVTPIARRDGSGYVMDLVLRNNRTSGRHPLGIFHPHQQVHHIKKENIGLIEVLGLAILPARLIGELELLGRNLAQGRPKVDDGPPLAVHAQWYDELKGDLAGGAPDEIAAELKRRVGLKFLTVLEHAGVFKRNEKGLAAFDRFVAAATGEST